MLMAARDDETGATMSDRQLCDEVATLFFAGHETTANALSWALWLVIQHQDCEARLRAELITVLAGAAPCAEDVARLPYLGATIKEALRLYPPIWLVVRTACETIDLGPLCVPKGGYLFFSPWLLHRRGSSWSEPDDFRPERWLSGEKPEKGAYLPFISGPRKCIGDTFALMEMTLVMATLLQRVRFSAQASAPVLPQPLVTLRPASPMWVALSDA
jgi:cytochrome P450